jgi:3-mercaptopyruvate sulfurtransferase SseA
MSAIPGPQKPVLRPPQELKKMLADRGITPGKKIVSYCEVGWQASYTYFLARYLGFDAGMYDGSYNEGTPPSRRWFGATPRVRNELL